MAKSSSGRQVSSANARLRARMHPSNGSSPSGNKRSGPSLSLTISTLSKWHNLPLRYLDPFDLSTKSPLAAADGLVCVGVGWTGDPCLRSFCVEWQDRSTFLCWNSGTYHLDIHHFEC